MSASLDTTVEAGKSLTGEPLRNPLTAKHDTNTAKVGASLRIAGSLPQRVLSVRTICSRGGRA